MSWVWKGKHHRRWLKVEGGRGTKNRILGSQISFSGPDCGGLAQDPQHFMPIGGSRTRRRSDECSPGIPPPWAAPSLLCSPVNPKAAPHSGWIPPLFRRLIETFPSPCSQEGVGPDRSSDSILVFSLVTAKKKNNKTRNNTNKH